MESAITKESMIILVGSVFIKIRSLWRNEILAEVNMKLYLPK